MVPPFDSATDQVQVWTLPPSLHAKYCEPLTTRVMLAGLMVSPAPLEPEEPEEFVELDALVPLLVLALALLPLEPVEPPAVLVLLPLDPVALLAVLALPLEPLEPVVLPADCVDALVDVAVLLLQPAVMTMPAARRRQALTPVTLAPMRCHLDCLCDCRPDAPDSIWSRNDVTRRSAPV
jgi:hypothetical protein